MNRKRLSMDGNVRLDDALCQKALFLYEDLWSETDDESKCIYCNLRMVTYILKTDSIWKT